MNDKNYVEPLNSANEAFITKVLKYLAVEIGTLASEADILSAIKSSGFKCLPRGVLATMILHGYAKTEGENIRLIIKKEGGEKMENYETRITSGEEKISKEILKYFGEGFQIGNPTVMTFLSCLETVLPSINKKVNAKNALKVMIRGEYLEIEEGEEPVFNFLEKPKAKVVLGPKGKEYLSL